ncbi:hypothetical protein LOTGIDRAFT_165034 [Lottia gigantea]|uniref:Bromodomain associated domain-containing protein n=1 Tax=Lottia gigantea TaxID=225164 RepID=V3ZYI0_LOTGI|nr:hypothetical protein LOTGIDRAFT_165034 [Lottia gigantea]ESO89437.1 hypothetical protein LOTGIDRAFT_165034 [Lottia gigantea]
MTLHTIRLIQYCKKLKQLIHSAQESKANDSDTTYPAAPPIPVLPEVKEKHKPLKPIPFIPPNHNSKFAQGIGDPPPVIDEISNHILLRRSVATVCAHTGFDTSTESVVETLTDILNEFYLNFTHHLRAAADNAAFNSRLNFPDVIEQVYHEIGFGSITCLHDYYQTRVVRYRENLERQCHLLAQEYEKLQEPSQQKSSASQPDTFHVIRIKEEACSEIQFPSLDDNDEGGETEHLLQLDGLGSFEITVEQETTSGLTTEVESKWSHGGKLEHQDSKSKSESIDETDDQTIETPADHLSDGFMSPGSIPVTDILSPPSISRPSKPKKNLTYHTQGQNLNFYCRVKGTYQTILIFVSEKSEKLKANEWKVEKYS